MDPSLGVADHEDVFVRTSDGHAIDMHVERLHKPLQLGHRNNVQRAT
jgi:hypothetical protein